MNYTHRCPALQSEYCLYLFIFFYNLNSFISVISINKILSYYSCNVNVGSFPDLVRINFSRNSLILYSLIMLSSPHVQISLSLRQDAQLKKMESQYSVFIYVVIHGTQISGLSDVKLSAFAEFVLQPSLEDRVYSSVQVFFMFVNSCFQFLRVFMQNTIILVYMNFSSSSKSFCKTFPLFFIPVK